MCLMLQETRFQVQALKHVLHNYHHDSPADETPPINMGMNFSNKLTHDNLSTFYSYDQRNKLNFVN